MNDACATHREPRRSHTAFVTAVALVGLVLVATGLLARFAPSSNLVAAGVVAACLPWTVLLRARLPRRALAFAAMTAVGVGAYLTTAPPRLSGDLHRYMWDARVALAGIDPYAHPPDSPVLASLRDASWRSINHPELSTVYPPLAQLAFLLGALATPVAYKGLALAAHLAIASFVAALTRRARPAILYALHPLALTEVAMHGHVDVFAALGLISFVWALSAGRVGLATVAACLTSGVKVLGLLVTPLLWRVRRAAGLTVALVTVACVVPLLGAGSSSERTGLAHYVARWEGNAGFYPLTRMTSTLLVDGIAWTTRSGNATLDVRFARPLLDRLEGTPLDLHPIFSPAKKTRHRGVLDRELAASLLARAASLVFVALVAFFAAHPGISVLAATRSIVFAALFASPVVHPWYLLVLLPLELARGGVAGLVWSLTVAVAYVPLDTYAVTREWQIPTLAWAFEMVVVAAFLLYDLQRASHRHTSPQGDLDLRTAPAPRGTAAAAG